MTMQYTPQAARPPQTRPADSEAFPDMLSAAHRMLEQGDALEAYRAFDEGVLAEVPHALEAYISHQRFDLN
jgi:hypothetical protein